jgi:hypothetical protein
MIYNPIFEKYDFLMVYFEVLELLSKCMQMKMDYSKTTSYLLETNPELIFGLQNIGKRKKKRPIAI